MEKLIFILKTARTNRLLITMLLTLLVFTQQAHSTQLYQNGFESFDGSRWEMDSDKSNEEDSDSKETTVAINHSLMSSPVQGNVPHVFYEIMDIEYDIEGEGYNIYQEIIDPDAHLRILFRKVISPNAP